MHTRAQSPSKRLTLLDVIATVSGITHNERETAAVVNHMLKTSQIAFSNTRRNPFGNLRRSVPGSITASVASAL
jgi:hypothetical protein